MESSDCQNLRGKEGGEPFYLYSILTTLLYCYSAQQSFPGAANMELLEQYKRQVSGPLSISGLMAGPPAEDSDDDYD